MEFCIVGSGRCGTTAMQAIFDSHPQIHVINETQWVPRMVSEFGSGTCSRAKLIDFVRHTHHSNGLPTQEFDVDKFLQVSNAPSQLTVKEFSDALGHYFAAQQGKSRYADKTPDYGVHIYELSQVWPECRFLHLIRDGRAVVRSMMQHDGYKALLASGRLSWADVAHDYKPTNSAQETTLSVSRMADLWAKRVALTREAAQHLENDRYLEVRYEDLVAQPRATLMRIADFLCLNDEQFWLEKSAVRIRPKARNEVQLQELAKDFTPAAMKVLEELEYINHRFAMSKMPARETIKNLAIGKSTSNTSNLTCEKTMKSIAISMVKNERDIIEPFLRHNHRFFDALFVIDNGSVDGTREIIHECARDLGNVVFCDRPEFAYHQGSFISKATRFIQSTYRAEFITFLDADEFLEVRGRAELETAYSKIPKSATGKIRWKTFLPEPAILDGDHDDPLKAIKLRRRRELPQYFKSVYRAGGSTSEIVVGQGAHSIFDPTSGAEVPSIDLTDIGLIHIPIRSADQLTSKALVGWIANAARNPDVVHSSQAFQWGELFERITNDSPELSAQDVSIAALEYAQDKRQVTLEEDSIEDALPFPILRKVSDGRFGSPLSNLAKVMLHNVVGEQVETSVIALKQDVLETQTDGEKSLGVFEDTWHLEKPFLDRAPFDYLVRKYKPATVLDVGCGSGVYLRLLKDLGVEEILGVDGISPEATVLSPEQYQKLDLHDSLDLGKKFQLTMCIEVLEHLDPSATQVFIDSLATHATDMILFSVAEPGQPGVDHINCQPMNALLEAWKERGWAPDIHETLAFRSLATLSWLRRNPVLLRPVSEIEDPDDAINELIDIASEPFKWYGQIPGIRAYAFSEDFPDMATVQPQNGASKKVKTIEPMGRNEERDSFVKIHDADLSKEIKQLHKELRHAKRYPWKYIRSAIRERLK
ncbi:sulfotransferase [Ruegeria sp. HKCCA6837]|uniref:sulfotransferase n=1 Tax=Ruegeria sp. HKCCA6837 TaxID=2682989 RepID=UPI00210FE8DF|nr:sulfotransferase [Ruegeria sp. HKCCA6837]